MPRNAQARAPTAPTMEFVELKKQYAALRESINARIQRVLDHGQYILGPEVAELEGKLAVYTGAKHCITVASGTEALLISLMALGVKSGDEVITTAFTFAATAEVIALLGARPVFVDVEPDTCNIDASRIEAAISSRTRAIIPVGLYGQCADMDEINAIAARRGVVVIEDAAQSFGAAYKQRKSCNVSTIGCTSFFPSKPLGCYGDGGAIFLSDDNLALACREIRVHGQSQRYVHTRIGVGGRMDTLQCAVVLAKLERFDWELGRREALAQLYRKLLAGVVPDHAFVTVRPDRNCVWAQFTLFVDQRERVRERMTAKGIPTAVHYPRALNQQLAFSQFGDPDACPNSVEAGRRVLSLPMSADLSEENVCRVVDALTAATGMD